MNDDAFFERPDFSADPSRPRAGRFVRFLVCAGLLAVACAAIWWIDRGAMLSNSHASVPAATQVTR